MSFKQAIALAAISGALVALGPAVASAGPLSSGSAGSGEGGGTEQAPEPGASTGSVDAIRAQVLDLVNRARASAGCGPVRTDGKLQTAAQRHSDDMAARGFFDHVNPSGIGPGGRIEAAGYRWSTYGENIARGQQSAAEVMTGWMNSPGHRANILNCAFTQLGTGVTLGSGGPWWTQNFGAPA
ncbi:CAP domain-containing protein [Nocardia asteroides]|uniref:CAP domain-containing protein n=1 Tax=Nocardia asteroides TaxID=1824 RepID=UPI001E51B5B5|nr:CAP domain-containing protein [Nocardia asteroides]UGT56967.1 CAP domain-containing protein [Nocardia asteroides]